MPKAMNLTESAEVKPKQKKILRPGKVDVRPSIYTEALADRICEIVGTHPVGLPTLCKMFPEIPSYETINVWRWSKKSFADKYAAAKRFQAEMMAESLEAVTDELLDDSYLDKDGVRRVDSGMVARARIITDSRKWTASKLAPKIYGDKQIIEQTTSENEKLKEEIANLRAELNKKNKRDY